MVSTCQTECRASFISICPSAFDLDIRSIWHLGGNLISSCFRRPCGRSDGWRIRLYHSSVDQDTLKHIPIQKAAFECVYCFVGGAVKRLKSHLITSDQQLHEFVSEGQCLKQLHHPWVSLACMPICQPVHVPPCCMQQLGCVPPGGCQAMCSEQQQALRPCIVYLVPCTFMLYKFTATVIWMPRMLQHIDHCNVYTCWSQYQASQIRYSPDCVG